MDSSATKNHLQCPVHHMQPLFNIHCDLITVRCCCDFFSKKYISYVDNKLKGRSINDLINGWEKDLLVNELQAC